MLNFLSPSHATTEWPQWPRYTDETVRNLVRVLESNRWAISGYWTGRESMEHQFAQRFAAYNGAEYCVPTTNGSSALAIALEALGIGQGDEVIVPALTWVATATSVLNVNAVPVLVDVDPNTYCIDPTSIERAITPRTKAIIPVHLFRCMADMDEIMRISDKYGIFVVEDCAQSHGTTWRGKHAGTIGHIGCFSFQQGKLLTAGEGGATLTNDADLYIRLQQLRADSRVMVDGSELEYGDMQLVPRGEVQGTNYCLSELQAAVLLEQIERLDDENKLRSDNMKYLDEKLSEIPGIQTMGTYPQITQQSCYSYAFKLNANSGVVADELCSKLQRSMGISSFHVHTSYPPIHKSPLFAPWTKPRYDFSVARTSDYWRALSFPNAEYAARQTVVAHHSLLLGSRTLLDRFIDTVAEYMYCEVIHNE